MNIGEPMPIERRGDTFTKTLRWTARSLSSIVISFALFMLVGSAGFDDTGPNLGITVFVIFMIPTMIALVLAWRWEKWGGLVAIAGSFAMGITVFFTAGSNQLMAGLLIPSPFMVSGILFLSSWYRINVLPSKVK